VKAEVFAGTQNINGLPGSVRATTVPGPSLDIILIPSNAVEQGTNGRLDG